MSQMVVDKKRRIPLLVQMMFICIISVILMYCGVAFYVFPRFEHELIEYKKADIKALVETAHSIVNDYYDRTKTGEFTEAEAKRRSLERLNRMRYAETGYFWVNDMTPTMVMHPIMPELNGKNLEKYTDADGKFMFLNFTKTCELYREGFVFYKWPEPKSNKQVFKVSFVKSFDPWGWVIGTGVYVTQVKRSLADLRVAIWLGTAAVVILLTAACIWLTHLNNSHNRQK